MVDPTNLKPRRKRSLLIASDSVVLAGTCFISRQEFTFGFPPTKFQMYFSKLPNSFCTSRNAFAFSYGGRDLQAVAHNAGIRQELFHAPLVVSRDFHGIEIVERLTVVFPFAQNGGPAQSRLGTFEDQHFKQVPIIATGTPHSSSWYFQ